MERFILRGNTAVLGSRYVYHALTKPLQLTLYSVWVFLLLGVEAIKTYRQHPYLEYARQSIFENKMLTVTRISSMRIPTWITPLALIVVTSVLLSNTSFLGHICAVIVGYLCKSTNSMTHAGTNASSVGLGYLKFLAPPEKIAKWIESKLNLLGRLPHYVSVDQKTAGRYTAVLPSSSVEGPSQNVLGGAWLGGNGTRLGP